MKVFKYRGINFERDFKTLKNDQFFASPFNQLNDPFEGVYNDQISSFLALIKTIFKANTNEVSQSIKDIKDLKNKLGIYSLSTTYKDELLWSHYADGHKGFCIEYDLERLKGKFYGLDQTYQFNVDYKEKPSTLTYNDLENNSLTKKLFATKSKMWSYEKEIRLIFDNNSLKDYHRSALTGIYFGIEMSYDKKQKFIEYFQTSDVKFYEMHRMENSYKLKRKLVAEGKRILKNKLNSDKYEILLSNHSPAVENFDVWYKSNEFDDDSLSNFFNAFREQFSTKRCNIHLYNSKINSELITKRIYGKDYINFADSCIAASYFNSPESFTRNPYKDSLYNDFKNCE